MFSGIKFNLKNLDNRYVLCCGTVLGYYKDILEYALQNINEKLKTDPTNSTLTEQKELFENFIEQDKKYVNNLSKETTTRIKYQNDLKKEEKKANKHRKEIER